MNTGMKEGYIRTIDLWHFQGLTYPGQYQISREVAGSGER